MPADPSDFVRHPRLAGQEVSQCVGFGEQEGQVKKTTVDCGRIAGEPAILVSVALVLLGY